MIHNSQLAIKLTNVSKRYYIHHEKPTLMERIINGKNEEFWALKNINLEIKKGERVGIIGANGSGKTTLLKTITGITSPTRGNVWYTGKIVSLIDLGAGFHPDLSGTKNIYLNGALLGLRRKEVSQKLREIVEFSGLGDFVNVPFYTYSSGMALRLGFSIAVSSNPDILILDENISVGDEEFKKKSFKKVKEMVRKNKTIVITSHDLEFVRENCDTVIWMDKGKIIMNGQKTVISKYEDFVVKKIGNSETKI